MINSNNKINFKINIKINPNKIKIFRFNSYHVNSNCIDSNCINSYASTTTASTTTVSTTTASTTTASTSTESTPTESTPTASTPTASTQSASFPIFKRKSQSSSSLDEANKKKQTNKFGDEKTNQKIMNTLLEIKKDITEIKKDITEIKKNGNDSNNSKIFGKKMEFLLLKLRSKRDNIVAKIKSSIFSTFGENSLPIRKAFKKYLLAFAVGVIEITLDPDNGGIQIKDVIMKLKIRKYIDKIENENIYISSSESESSSGSTSEFKKDNNDNMNKNNEDDGVIYIDSNEENNINLDKYNINESDIE
ncbi:hypothetical protein Glove_48g146 [Diversispora epigaea]|uniref:Uncharacterized protein n=1 Tax=Diversispora epigaea TaxID=1348612 RepID=A0A397JHC2_9GLOM|nr:hypothetical protein Glove_48g146 [Diversispora epigaea]